MIKEVKIIKPYLRKPLNERTLEGSLFKEGLSRAPKTTMGVTMMIDSNRRPLTGIDENSIRIKSIRDENAREIEFNRVKALRERLESETGEDLRPESNFWKDKIEIPYELIDGDNVFDLTNAYKAIDFYWLTQLPIVAASLDELKNGKVNRAGVFFYVYSPEVETINEFNRNKRTNDAVYQLGKMGETEAKRVAFLLNLKLPENTIYQIVYNSLDAYLKTPKTHGSHDPIEEFTKVASYTPQVMAIKVLVKTLIEDNIIKLRGDSVLEGENILAKSIQDLENKLAEDPEFFVDMETKVKNKRNFTDNI
jgi:hypothetical protein